MNIIWDYKLVWSNSWPKSKCRSLWPMFHGPMILCYILKTIWYIYYHILGLCDLYFIALWLYLAHNSGHHVGRRCVRPSVRPSVCRTFVCLSFPDDNLSKHQWIFTKLGMCIDIVDVWFGIANWQILWDFDGSYLPETCPYFRFRTITWVNNKRFSPNLVCALILWRSGFGLLMCKFHQFLTELSARDTPIFLFPDYNLSK